MVTAFYHLLKYKQGCSYSQEGNKTLEQWFPKSGPRTIFGPRDFPIWSARQINLLKIQYFVVFVFVETVNDNTTNFYFMIHRVDL
jgi:hypothetical protein